MTITLSSGSASLDDLEKFYREGTPFEIAKSDFDRIRVNQAVLTACLQTDQTFYGINTGFGKLASVKIGADKLSELQQNLVRSHSAGFGQPLPPPVVRLIMALKCLSFGRGASGVRPELVMRLQEMSKHDILPVIPEKGSVGASGDLAPLAHLALTLIGEGEVFYHNKRVPTADALGQVGLTPLTLHPKEGLALLNGTQVSTALALAGLFDAWQLTNVAIITAALSIDAAMGSSAPFRHEIHDLRGHAGQIESAARLRQLLSGSAIRESHRDDDDRVQDPYCLRCAPQVLGACIDQLRHVGRTLEIEANAATDNPLIVGEGDILSGGNFHAEPVGLVADLAAIAISEIGCIAQRRVALLVDPALSFGLPAFLAPEPGLKSGLMIAEVTSAALMSENKALSNPRSVDSTPTSANQEDHVSMACHGARRLLEMTENLSGILAVEAMAGAQGVELRAPLQTSGLLGCAVEEIRHVCPPLTDDRNVSPDIEEVARLLKSKDSFADVTAAIDPMPLT